MLRAAESDPQAELFALREQLQRRLMAKFAGSLSWEDCEDITADAIADKAALVPAGRTSQQRVAWFNTVLDNAAKDELRRRGVIQRGDVKGARPQTVALLDDDDRGDHGAFIEDGGFGVVEDAMDRAYDEADAINAARRGLQSLTRSERAIILLRFKEGLTLAQMEAELDLPSTTLQDRYRRAREKFKAAVAGPADDERCGALRMAPASLADSFADEHVDPVAVARWEAHLHECTSCRSWVVQVRQAAAAVPMLPMGGGLFTTLLGKLGLGGVADRVHAASDQVATAVGLGGGGAGAGAGVLSAIGGKAAATCITAVVCAGGAAFVAAPVVQRAVDQPKNEHRDKVASKPHAKAAGGSGAQRPTTTISSAPAAVAPAPQVARKATRTQASMQTTPAQRKAKRERARVVREKAQAKKARAAGSAFTPDGYDPTPAAPAASASTSSSTAPVAPAPTPPPAPADSSSFSGEFSP